MSLTLLDYPMQPVLVSPGLYAATNTFGTNVTFTFNAADDKIAMIFVAGEDVPDLVSFLITGYTSTGTIDATLETLAVDGTPSGTPVTNSATVSVSVSSTGVKSTAAGMAGTAVLTVGDLYAIVLTATAGFGGTFVCTYAVSTVGYGSPYLATKDSAGSWTKAAVGNAGMLIGAKNAAGNYFRIAGAAGPVSAAPAYQAYSSSTNPDERGNRFVPDVPCTCYGALVVVSGGSSPGDNDDFDVLLYSAPTTAISQLETKSFDGDANVANAMHFVIFDSPQDLTAGTEYGITVRATGSETQSVPRWDFTANGDLRAHMGVDFYSITRNDATGNATGVSTQVYGVYPLFSKFDDGAGGGGGGMVRHPGMTGGLGA
jgi:hypothetical protein